MNELTEVLKTLSVQELHVSPYDCRVGFLAPWEHTGNLMVTLVATTPHELTQAILRMTGDVDNI